RPLRELAQVVAAGVLVLPDQACACLGAAAVGSDRFVDGALHRGDPQRLVVQVIAQRAQQQAPFGLLERGTDHDHALGGTPGIADGARGVGGADQHDQLAGLLQRLTCDGGVAVVERLETADEDQIVVVHEAPSRWWRGDPGSVPGRGFIVTPPHRRGKPPPTDGFTLRRAGARRGPPPWGSMRSPAGSPAMADPNDRPSREEAEAAVRTLLRWAGEDPSREGLLDTPRRVVEAYGDWFAGYGLDPHGYLARTFEEVE